MFHTNLIEMNNNLIYQANDGDVGRRVLRKYSQQQEQQQQREQLKGWVITCPLENLLFTQ